MFFSRVLGSSTLTTVHHEGVEAELDELWMLKRKEDGKEGGRKEKRREEERE
jgi:hypothetical protein